MRRLICRWPSDKGKTRAVCCDACRTNKQRCRLNQKLPPRLRDGAVLYQRKRREIANREIAGEKLNSNAAEREDAEQGDGSAISTIFLGWIKILELHRQNLQLLKTFCDNLNQSATRSMLADG